MSGSGLQRPGYYRMPAPDPEEVEMLVEGLEVIQLLGAGGMGAVYLARQPELDRLVAIKLLAPDRSADPVFQERFLREARTLARLNHPHIVSLYDVGRAGANWYIVMEYVDGINLRSLIEHQRLSPSESLRLIPQICDAMQFAHTHGVVHRDIKPENVLVDQNGQVKIADFGLAKLMGDKFADCVTLTDLGLRMGTIGYMAPEQSLQTSEVDHRADIYSLGIIFYEMLTGKRPALNYAPPSKLTSVDARVDKIVSKCLREDPDERFQNAEEVKLAIERVDVQKQNRIWIPVVAVLSLLVLVFVVNRTISRSSFSPTPARIAPDIVKDETTVLNNDPRPLLMPFQEDVARAQQVAWAKNVGQPVEIPDVLGMTFQLIPPGELQLSFGHTARITKPYYMSDSEVTVGAFRRFVKETNYRTEAEATGLGGWVHPIANSPHIENQPEFVWNHIIFASDDSLPVTLLSMTDIVAFIDWLSKKDDRHYRLPTNAEWTWAAMAGNVGCLRFTDESVASQWGWHGGNSGNRAHPVRSKKRNAWGIYDAFGNAGEFTSDGNISKFPTGVFDDPSHPVTDDRFAGVGGSFADPFQSTNHDLNGRMPFHSVGFRLLLEVPGHATKPR